MVSIRTITTIIPFLLHSPSHSGVKSKFLTPIPLIKYETATLIPTIYTLPTYPPADRLYKTG